MKGKFVMMVVLGILAGSLACGKAGASTCSSVTDLLNEEYGMGNITDRTLRNDLVLLLNNATMASTQAEQDALLNAFSGIVEAHSGINMSSQTAILLQSEADSITSCY